MIPTRDPAHDSTPPPAQHPTAAEAAAHLPPRPPRRPGPAGAAAAGGRVQPALQAALVRLDGQLTRVDGKADHLAAGDTGNPATEVLFLSRLAVTKYRLVRRAVDLMTAGLALGAAAATVAAAVLR